MLALILLAADLPGFAPPQSRIEDLYKWTFHATMGGDHAVPDEEGPRRWLDREWATLGPPLSGEPLIVPLRADDAIVRLNLRPYRARGGQKEGLLRAFVRGARGYRPDRAEFTRAWLALGQRLEQGAIGRVRHEDWLRLDRRLAQRGYPAIGHSAAYELRYRPAYRVLPRAGAAALVEALASPRPRS